jgi:hypothetical protein
MSREQHGTLRQHTSVAGHCNAAYTNMGSKRKSGKTVSDLWVAVIDIPTFFFENFMRTTNLLRLVGSDHPGGAGVGGHVRHSRALPRNHHHHQQPIRGQMSVTLYIVFLSDYTTPVPVATSYVFQTAVNLSHELHGTLRQHTSVSVHCNAANTNVGSKRKSGETVSDL